MGGQHGNISILSFEDKWKVIVMSCLLHKIDITAKKIAKIEGDDNLVINLLLYSLYLVSVTSIRYIVGLS